MTERAPARRSEVAIPETRAVAPVGNRGLQFQSMTEMFAFAKQVAVSGIAPKGFDTPEKVLVAIQLGMEAGLTPMRALSSIYVVGGVPGWKGDMARALINASGVLRPNTKVVTWIEVAGRKVEGLSRGQLEEQNAMGVCETWRDGWPEPERTTFSVSEAKQAGLWGKDGPWKLYPQRMLCYRALGYHSKEYYGDVLFGLLVGDEVDEVAERIGEARVLSRPEVAPPPEKPPAWATEESPVAGAPPCAHAGDLLIAANGDVFCPACGEVVSAPAGDALESAPSGAPAGAVPDETPARFEEPEPDRPCRPDELRPLAEAIHARCAREEDPLQASIELRSHLRAAFGDAAKLMLSQRDAAVASAEGWERSIPANDTPADR